MSIYNKLHEKYTNAWSAEVEYWGDLVHLADRARSEFETYLGIAPGSTVVINEITLPALQLGKMVEAEFVECAASELERNYRALEVALRLNFQIELDEPKKVQIVFTLSLSGVNGSFEASYDDNNFKPAVFSVPLFDTLFAHLVSTLN